jgi:hypothetical protein
MEQFDMTREQITAVLDFVAQSLKVDDYFRERADRGNVRRAK